MLAGFKSLTDVLASTQVPWVVLVDGLDEVADGLTVFLGLLPLLKGRRCAAIAVGRPLSLPQEVVTRLSGHLYGIMPWTHSQLDAFITGVSGHAAGDFVSALARCPGELAATPLFATAAWHAFQQNGLDAIRTTAGVFQGYIDALTTECRRRLRDDRPDLFPDRLKQIVADAALVSVRQQDVPWAADTIEAIGSTSTFFRVRGEGIEWRHLLVRDFLAARAIASVAQGQHHVGVDVIDDPIQLIARHDDANARRVALFVVSLLSDHGQSGRALAMELFARWVL
jgi:hypothetical protein